MSNGSPPETPKPWKPYVTGVLLIVVAASLWLPWYYLGTLKPRPTADQESVVAAYEKSVSADGLKCETQGSYETKGIRWVWIGVMGLMTLFVLIAGRGITGLWRGAFIDSRNKISLSRFQMILWTILLLSAYLVAALINIKRGQPNPIDIALEETLWLLMGISTTSLVGSPLIKSGKAAQGSSGAGSPPTSAANRTLRLLEDQGVDTTRVEPEGHLLVNKDPADASWGDMFRGEDVGNAAHLDLGKIQMLYFTVIIAFAYGTELANIFRNNPCGIKAFPLLSGGMIALLGISHAGYLANKAVTGDAA